MQTEQLIKVDTFCNCHNVTFSFINSLHEIGLIEIKKNEDQNFFPESDLEKVEKLVRLHNDLNINFEGVEAIIYLLDQLKKQQDIILILQNKLRFYEA